MAVSDETHTLLAIEALNAASKQLHQHKPRGVPQPRAVVLRIISGLRPDEPKDSPRRYAGSQVNANCPIRKLHDVIYPLIGQFLVELPSDRPFVRYDYQQSRHPLLGRSHCAVLLHEDCEQRVAVHPTVSNPWQKLAARLEEAAGCNSDCSVIWYKVATLSDFEPLPGEPPPFGLVPLCKPLNLAQLVEAVDDMSEHDEFDDSPPWFWRNVQQSSAVKVTIRLESRLLDAWAQNQREHSQVFGSAPVRSFRHGPQALEHPLLQALSFCTPMFAIRDMHRVSVRVCKVRSSHHQAELTVWRPGAARLARDAKLRLLAQRNAEEAQRLQLLAEVARLEAELLAGRPAAKRAKLS